LLIALVHATAWIAIHCHPLVGAALELLIALVHATAWIAIHSHPLVGAALELLITSVHATAWIAIHSHPLVGAAFELLVTSVHATDSSGCSCPIQLRALVSGEAKQASSAFVGGTNKSCK
jgi:hypothetical protein